MPRLQSLAFVSLSDLQNEISRRTRKHPALQRRRAALMKQLTAIEAELGEGSSTGTVRHGPGRPKGSKNRTSAAVAGTPRRARATNDMTLSEALATALKGKTMSVAEVTDAIRKAGYKSDAASFRIMVNGALGKPLFKRVSRGMYTVK